MHLARFAVQGFRSYVEEQVVELDPHITLLAGQNNVGKSAFLHAMRSVLMAQDGSHSDFATVWFWEFSTDDLIGLRRDGEATNHVLEDLIGDGRPLVATAPGLITEYVGIPRPSSLTFPSLEVTGRFNLGGPRSDPNDPAVDELLGLAGASVGAAMGNQVYIGPRKIDQGPRHLVPESRLTPNASNLSNVLFDMQVNHPDSSYEQLLRFMRAAVPGLTMIQIRTNENTNPSSVQGEPYARFGTNRPLIPLHQCGTGVEQLVALGIAVLTEPERRLMLIDEPQAYLHPRAERAMLALIEEHGEHQYVIASHSHVLLRSRPISQARLVTLDDGRSRISEIASASVLLDELDVTAADLWLPEAILWVEGPTEADVLSFLAEAELDHAERSTLVIRPMPLAASRFSKKQADATYRFCDDVTTAVAPLPLRMRFVFDRDEKTPDEIEAIKKASDGQAEFLAVREIENLFLDEHVLHLALAEAAVTADAAAPHPAEIDTAIQEHLDDIHNLRLFPRGLTEGVEARIAVRGSKVLEELWWSFTTTEYDKVRDGRRLAEIASESAPEILDPLRRLLREMVHREDG